MMMAGRTLALIAAAAGVAKLGLLLLLVPRYGAIGAAIATAVGGVIAFWGQTYFGAREVGFRPFPLPIAWILGLALIVAGAGRGLYQALAPQMSELLAVTLTSVAALGVLGVALFALMDASDRLELRRLLGRPPGVPSGGS
jgi:O-antigen/teichoic acid export membrane protein